MKEVDGRLPMLLSINTVAKGCTNNLSDKLLAHAKTQRRKGKNFASLGLCVRFNDNLFVDLWLKLRLTFDPPFGIIPSNLTNKKL